jgi:hypothetical protein
MDKNLYVSRFELAEQLYLRRFWMFPLTKVPKLRSEVTEQIYENINKKHL